MKILKIISLILALAFIFFGYNIYFKKKYKLINNFEKDYKNGLKDEKYAKKVGLIELLLGIFFIILFLVL
ncbi:hypothetical protein [Anaerococcus jeddahensis]|uniref:hypothetical protein n=1 Tax=Anaerococcus jeddahensis TaxID=1673719 RepID=UPI0006724C59|nr:hypothetical protein [Anaerococcus jeddahensis]